MRKKLTALLVALGSISALGLSAGSVAQAATCTGVGVTPRSGIRAAIESHPPDTTFCLFAGTYRPTASLRPKEGQRFIGEAGAVLDGRDTVKEGFDGGTGQTTVDLVTVRGLTIKNFNVGIRAGHGWRIIDNNLGYNLYNGVRLTHRNVLRNNYIHHNVYGGVFGAGHNILVEGNELAFNHAEDIGPNTCKGKFVKTTHLIVRDNYAHGQLCPVLWADLNSYHPVFEGNVVVDNFGPGIDCEISYKCIIRNNIVRNNPRGILVSATPDAEVYGNTVSNNSMVDINIVQQGDDDGIRSDYPSRYGPHLTKNNYVHDNYVTVTTGLVGVTVTGYPGDWVYSPEANNRFENNDYRFARSGTGYFTWLNKARTWRGWRSFGHDTFGSFTRF
jgi:parallel beta-helix repeat protein